MNTNWKIVAGWLLGLSSLALVVPDRSDAARHAGLVIAVDKATGTIVMGDMGPRLRDGLGEITRYTMQVAPSTEIVRVKRAAGVAPSGWFGDYVETRLSAGDVKPGDFVAVTSEGKGRRLKAVKVTVVDTSEP